jgi:hypothetical protein
MRLAAVSVLAFTGIALAQAPNLTALQANQAVTRAASRSEWQRQMAALGLAAIRPGANELDVDADSVIALAAPRPIFIGAGASSPEPGKPDDAWVDAHGSWMSLDMAGDVWTLYGKKRLDRTFPQRLTISSSGDVAFRQHDQGHTPNPNWSWFLDFAAPHFAQ